MFWNRAQLNGAGYVVQIMRQFGVPSILWNLYDTPGLRAADLKDLFEAANSRDEPLVGARDVSGGISKILSHLTESGLVVRSGPAVNGTAARYEITEFGAGMLLSLEQTAVWGTVHFDLAVRAARIRYRLEPVEVEIGEHQRILCTARGLAIGVLDKRWAFAILGQVVEEPEGIQPSVLRERINTMADGNPVPIARRLTTETKYQVLHYLTDAGLLSRREVPGAPTRVWYSATQAGVGLMVALEPAAVWGAAHDEHLVRIIAATTGWFVTSDDPSGK